MSEKIGELEEFFKEKLGEIDKIQENWRDRKNWREKFYKINQNIIWEKTLHPK